MSFLNETAAQCDVLQAYVTTHWLFCILVPIATYGAVLIAWNVLKIYTYVVLKALEFVSWVGELCIPRGWR